MNRREFSRALWLGALLSAGSPEVAGTAASEEVRRRRAPLLAAAHQAAIRAKARLGT